MHSAVAVGASVLAALSFFQACPAPPFVIAGIAAEAAGDVAGVIGDIASGPNKREVGHAPTPVKPLMPRQSVPPGVPQQNYDECVNDLSGASVTISGPVDNGPNIIVDGLPPSCMDLATVLIGTVDGPVPIPLGTATLEYQNVTSDDYSQLESILNGAVNS